MATAFPYGNPSRTAGARVLGRSVVQTATTSPAPGAFTGRRYTDPAIKARSSPPCR